MTAETPTAETPTAETAFDPQAYVDQTLARLRPLAGVRVLVTVSGGVDSTTSARLLMSVGCDSVHLMIDSGLLRCGEPEEPRMLLAAQGIAVETLDAADAFRKVLTGLADSRDKREAFRELYFDLIESYMDDHGIEVVAQGSQFHRISAKQAHNAPTDRFLARRFQIVEPVLGLDKIRVRAVAETLGLPPAAIHRRPFPGPGLLVRFGGPFDTGRLSLIREATAIVDAFVNEHSATFADCYQIFPYLPAAEPVTYVDTDGTGSLGSVLLLRAIREHPSATTATYMPFEPACELREKLVARLMRLPGVARVCLDLTPKFGLGADVAPGATIEYA
ncbi:MAG TPA: hypothetical protein VFC19_19805 [Candidatus Limnocylindrales bacterium]|nr:hypothetical protein [Candidatus Limnocylindrales bacterium]